jgi:uncharacterized membrane protein
VACVRAPTLLAAILVIVGVALLTVGVLGWRQLLPRNRFAGIRTPATLRSDAAFMTANRVAAPPVLAAGVLCTVGGGLALGATGPALTVIVSVTGAGAVGLLLAGGLLGHRAAATTVPPRPGGCAGCSCGGAGCTAP